MSGSLIVHDRVPRLFSKVIIRTRITSRRAEWFGRCMFTLQQLTGCGLARCCEGVFMAFQAASTPLITLYAIQSILYYFIDVGTLSAGLLFGCSDLLISRSYLTSLRVRSSSGAMNFYYISITCIRR